MTKCLGVVYAVVLVALVYFLSTDRKEVPKLKSKPAAETCQSTDGWTASIEESGPNQWACVMRNGKRIRAFFY